MKLLIKTMKNDVPLPIPDENGRHPGKRRRRRRLWAKCSRESPPETAAMISEHLQHTLLLSIAWRHFEVKLQTE